MRRVKSTREKYVPSSQVKWALWQWMQALAAFFFLGPSLSFRVSLIGLIPVEGGGSVSDAESLSWRRCLADGGGGAEDAEDRVGLVGCEEGPGSVMDSVDGMADGKRGGEEDAGQEDDGGYDDDDGGGDEEEVTTVSVRLRLDDGDCVESCWIVRVDASAGCMTCAFAASAARRR